tara:strand:+ start:722 stop:3139 length:2418 start_codon:yes stop_codon:yes gene_type:complete
MANLFDVYKVFRPGTTILSDDFNSFQSALVGAFQKLGTTRADNLTGVEEPFSVGTPTAATHAVRKDYYESSVNSLSAAAVAGELASQVAAADSSASDSANSATASANSATDSLGYFQAAQALDTIMPSGTTNSTMRYNGSNWAETDKLQIDSAGVVTATAGLRSTGAGTDSFRAGKLAGETNQGNNGIIISAKGSAVDDDTDGHIHITSDDGSIDFTTANGWTATDSAGTFDLKSTVGKIGDVFQGKNDGDPIIMTWVGNSNTGGYATTEMTAGTLVANPNVLIWQASSIESHSCQWETADHDEANFITGMANTNNRMCGFIKGQHVSPALAAANKMQELFNVRVYLIMTYQGGCPSDLVNPNLSDATFGSVDPAIDSEYDFTGNYSGNNNMWWFHSTAVNDALTSIQAGTNGATAYDQDYVDFVGDTLGQGDALLSTALINNRTIEEAEIMYVENMTAFVHAAEGTTPILQASSLDFASLDGNLIVSVANGGWAKNQHTKWFSIDMPAGSRGIFGIAAAFDNFNGLFKYAKVAKNLYRGIAAPTGRRLPLLNALALDETKYGTVDHLHPGNTSNLAIGANAALTCVQLANSAPRGEDLLASVNAWAALNTFTAGLESTGAGANSFRAGPNAGLTTQGVGSVAIGNLAGQTNQGNSAIAIGHSAGTSNQHANSILINSTGLARNTVAAGDIRIESSGGTLIMDGATGDWLHTGSMGTSSDFRLKENVKPITDALGKVNTLNGITFSYIEKCTVATGLIAQEVQAILPEAVIEDGEGYLAVAYGNMVGLLVESIKELTARVEALET